MSLPILYHGTDMESALDIKNNGINIKVGRKRVDFGRGFYTTPNPIIALSWARRKSLGSGSTPALVSLAYDESILNTMVYSFNIPDLRWGQFIVNNRLGYTYINSGCVVNKDNNLDGKYDIVSGMIAGKDIVPLVNSIGNPKHYRELREDDLRKIVKESLGKQYTFHSEKALSCILSIRIQRSR